ncbi:MAG: YciI family protein [Nocardioides sp.]|nr:YciI family protein [Nocardioides sp.]
MTEYLLAVNGNLDEDAADTRTMADYQPMFEAVDRFNEKLKAAGAWVFAGGLHPVSTTTTVDNTGDAPVVTDGPFVESKEYLGGFWVIEAPDLDAALEWAKEGSKACAGRVEVRPFQSEADDAAMRAGTSDGE